MMCHSVASVLGMPIEIFSRFFSRFQDVISCILTTVAKGELY
jgi:hypothetical protein